MNALRSIVVVLGALAVGIVIGRSSMTPVAPNLDAQFDFNRVGLTGVRHDVKLVDRKLEDAIGDIARMYGIALGVDWVALEASGLERDQLVSADVVNVQLEELLGALIIGDGPETIGYKLVGEHIVVTSSADAARHVFTRVYDIQLLLIEKEEAVRQILADFSLLTGQYGKGRQSYSLDRKVIAESIAHELRETIGEDTWKEHGGKFGSIRYLGQHLIVTNTPGIHRGVARKINGWHEDVVQRTRNREVLIKRLQKMNETDATR